MKRPLLGVLCLGMICTPIQATVPRTKSIRIKPESIICVYSDWFFPNAIPTTQGKLIDMSPTATALVKQAYADAGGPSGFRSSTGRRERFAFHGSVPSDQCAQTSAIRISMNYGERPNGHAYVCNYSIQQGSVVIRGTFGEDLNPNGDVEQFNPTGNILISVMIRHAETIANILVAKGR